MLNFPPADSCIHLQDLVSRTLPNADVNTEEPTVEEMRVAITS